MPGGTEYIVHDIDVNNHIVGKARFSGHVKVSEAMSVDGFGGHSILDDVDPNRRKTTKKDVELDSSLGESAAEERLTSPPRRMPPPSFHPPSFGVTVLGNSHGFDKSGSVSGYVLWINGRGVMIDPPPYSSATLEREGIRPRMIVGIVLTHCHADHDAGAFQKVLTGSPVVVITTPTIYKSFIRKYAALSALSPALLRHCHRYKPAIIGQPLRFQGATFHFTYTLHSIPCVGFRVEWRGRSMVFTGDHLNKPSAIEELTKSGVLTKERAADLTRFPLQDSDLLLHEAGTPPLHTPLDVLLQLPPKVKKRLYVVHTSNLPEDCELRVAPTGTAGTIRLDQVERRSSHASQFSFSMSGYRGEAGQASSLSLGDDEFLWNGRTEYETISEESATTPKDTQALLSSSFANVTAKKSRSNSVFTGEGAIIPLVSLRPASSTDAWFILNLLSAVPFLTRYEASEKSTFLGALLSLNCDSLSYASTMELLETAKVDAYSQHDVIVPASRRGHTLCVVWEGTCSERRAGTSRSALSTELDAIDEDTGGKRAVWHAGDWTGPIALQPDRRLSGDGPNSETHDVVAVSSEGAKVITVEHASLHTILKSGSKLYLKYLERKALQERRSQLVPSGSSRDVRTEKLMDKAVRLLNVLDLLNCNSAFRKLSAVQKRHLESLAEGPVEFQPGERLWRAGAPVDKAFVIVEGTASFVPKRRNAGSAAVAHVKDSDGDKMGDPSVGDSMRVDALKAIKELGVKQAEAPGNDESSMSSVESEQAHQIQFDSLFSRRASGDAVAAMPDSHDYAKLSRGLQKRADFLQREGGSVASEVSGESSVDGDSSYDYENESQLDYTFTDEADNGQRSRRSSVIRRRSSRARFANKVLGRLYSRRAFTGGLVFSRGHFLGDVSKMVAGLLAHDGASEAANDADFGDSYGFGDRLEGEDDGLADNLAEMVIHEQEGDQAIMHSSTLTAGKDGCVALAFPKASLIPFLDEYPGLLLSLLGTQVVV